MLLLTPGMNTLLHTSGINMLLLTPGINTLLHTPGINMLHLNPGIIHFCILQG
jgi:hypothetical protein